MKKKLVPVKKGNSIEWVQIGPLQDAKGFLKGVSKRGLRDHGERF